ncbi:MAG: glycosyltransferase family 39 protein [Patescibacteria group bacterium]
MARKSLLILLGILLLTFVFRVFKISSVPLYGDELTMVTDSYTLLHTGMDQTGKLWPLTFSMGEGRSAGYIYASIPFVALFGPTVWGIRGLSILSSLGISLLIFLLAKKLFAEKVGMWASFLVAVSPWDLNLGRGGFESHFALFLVLWGTYLLLQIKKNKLNLLWTTLVWGLAVNTYPTYKLILPVFLPVVVWYLGGLKTIFSGKKLIIVLSGILSVGIIGITLSQTFIGGSEDRFKTINIFSTNMVAVEQDVIFNRTVNSGNKFLAIAFYNKPLEYFKLLKDSYLKNFSLEFLVISADGNPRHNMATTGVIYMVELITIVLGVKFLLDNREKRKDLIFLAVWLAVAPLAAIFTLDNHGLRTNFMLPPLILLSSLGIEKLFKLKKPLFTRVMIIFWLIQFIPMMERLYFLAPNRFARFWSNLAKDVSIKVDSRKNNFDYVILSTRIDNLEYAYPVYSNLNPKEIISNNQEKTILEGYKFKKFENVYLGSIPEENIVNFINILSGKVMYVGPFSEANLFGKYEILYDGDKVPSGIVYEKQ